MINEYLETLEGRLRGPARRSILSGGHHWDAFTAWLGQNGGECLERQRQLEIWRDPVGFYHLYMNGTVGVYLPPSMVQEIFGSIPDGGAFADKVRALSAGLNVAIAGGDMPAECWAFLDALRHRHAAEFEQWKIWARAQVKAGSLKPVTWGGAK